MKFVKFLDIPDDLIANCLSFLGPNTTILHTTPADNNDGSCGGGGGGGGCFLMATKSLILTCKQLRQRIKSSIVIKVVQIWKSQLRHKLIVESWGDLSFYYNTTPSLVSQALIQIYELYHCGYDIYSLQLRICRGDIPILQALLSKNFLPIPTDSFILLFDYKNINPNPAFLMFPSIEQRNHHPMARFIKQYLDDQKWNRKERQTRFGSIQDVHSILNMKNNKMETLPTKKRQQIRKLQTIFVWDSTIWDENQIINFISLIKSLEVLHFTIVPEETLKRGQLNPQGKVVQQQPNQHSDIEMMSIFKRILMSTCFGIDDDGKRKNGYDDDDDDDDGHSSRPQFRSSSSGGGGGGGIHTLTLQSQSSLYNHVIDENLINASITTTTNIMPSSLSSSSSSALLQSNTLQQLDIVDLDQCYFAALLDVVVVCPNLQQFRYKEKEWNLLLLPPLNDDDEKQLHEKESLLQATQQQQQQQTLKRGGGGGGDTHQTSSSSLTSLSTTNDRSTSNSSESTTTATASSSPSSSHTKKLKSQAQQQDSKIRVTTKRLITRKFEQATTVSSSDSTVDRFDGNTTTTRNIQPKRFTLKAPYECDMQAFL